MDPFMAGLAAAVAAVVDRVLERRARRRQRGYLMEVIVDLPPGTQVGEWYGSGGWWITLPHQALNR
jgi:hypothetical protein